MQSQQVSNLLPSRKCGSNRGPKKTAQHGAPRLVFHTTHHIQEDDVRGATHQEDFGGETYGKVTAMESQS
jgi:hypothetical protein